VKGKFLLSMLLLLLPLSAVGQVAKASAPADVPDKLDRYEIFAGFDYSSANQAKGSSALLGFNVGGSAKLKKWLGGTVDFGDYGHSSGTVKPTMTTVLAGPEFYIPSDKLTGFLHVMFGTAHTGDVGAIPDQSFAYAIGGGVEYKLYPHLSVRATGDGIYSSFVIAPANSGFSPHDRVNPRATIGAAYHF
jgi:opacity protein-like surface antigen